MRNFFLVTRKSFLRKNLLYSLFSLFERKDAAKEAKKLAVLSPVQTFIIVVRLLNR